MSWKHFAPVPQYATLSFGGYSFVHPQVWERYLDKVIREDYPQFFAGYLQGRWNDARWRDQESCILSALEEYLLHEFGFCIPEENLFKVFNKDGEGLELSNMLEAISAVIEPIGLEIDWVLATDPDIRAALGKSEKIIDLGHASRVAGKPGLCMINVKEGYSHAFFWRKIDPRGFKLERFRLVILIKKNEGDRETRLSSLQSLVSFLQYVRASQTTKNLSKAPGAVLSEKIQLEIQELEEATQSVAASLDPDTRTLIDQHLVSLLDTYRVDIMGSNLVDRRTCKRARIILEAGRMVQKVIRESSLCH